MICDIRKELRARGIWDERVIEAAATIPREAFVPEQLRSISHSDQPLPIGFDQTISTIYICAVMVQSLDVGSKARVLEIGAGSGYHAALLGAIVSEVVSLEVIPELAEQAGRNLRSAGCEANIRIVCREGSKGYPELAPYDGISVAAAASRVPPELLPQLKDRAKLVIPVGTGEQQELQLISRNKEQYSSRSLCRCRFVPLRGNYKLV
jgi:protein-L-isoaspartate(D-aspartate) O-methyltransferase